MFSLYIAITVIKSEKKRTENMKVKTKFDKIIGNQKFDEIIGN